MPVLAPCRGCGAAIDCQRGLNNPDASDYAYNLTADPILPILINCPQGFSCLPGPGETTQIFLNCCGHLLSTTISGEMTPAQIVAQFEEMLDRCNTTFAAECNRTPGQDGGGGDGGGGGGGNGPDPPNQLTFCANTPQTALAHCQFGGVFSYTTVAGRFVAVDNGSGGNCQATVNAAALAYAQNQANTLMNRNCVAPQPGDPFNGWLCLGEAIDVPDDYYAVPVPSQPYAWGILAGSLPPGITLDPTGPPTFPTATLNGTPTTPGNYSWVIQVNGLINFWEHIYINDSLAVFGVTNPTLPQATAGAAYSEQILTAGGTAPVTFVVKPGGPFPPAWVTLDSDGTVHGTPAVPDGGTHTFDVEFTDADHGTCTQTISITVASVGFLICQWGPALIDANLNFSGLNPSVEPAWNGVFDKTIVGTGIWGTIWYFTGQSIISNPLIFPEKVAANWSAGYPVPNWQDNADYTMLAWNTVFSQWYLLIQEIGFGPVWIGTGSTNPLDPTGVYNLVGGTSVAPTTLSIVDSVHPNQCCPDWTTLLWGVPDFTGTQGTGNATFTPNSVASNSAHAFADSPSTTFGANRGQVQNTGSLNYNGKGCHCNAHIVQSVLDPNNLQESTGVVFITIDGNPILSYQNNGNVNTDMAFDLPDTGGVSKVVNVLVFVEVPIDNFVLIVDHENIDLQVTITNI